MLIASTPHPRSHRSPPAAELGKSVSMRQALAHLAQRRPAAVVLRKAEGEVMGRRPSLPAVHSGPRTIELAIRLSDGSFETKVIVPIDATDAERDSAIQRWLGLAAQALALGVENLTATLPRDAQ